MVTENERMDLLNALAAKEHIERSLSLAGQFTAKKLTAASAVSKQTAIAQKLRADGDALRRQAEGLKTAFKK